MFVTRGQLLLRVAQIAALALAVLGVVEVAGLADDFTDPPGGG